MQLGLQTSYDKVIQLQGPTLKLKVGDLVLHMSEVSYLTQSRKFCAKLGRPILYHSKC